MKTIINGCGGPKSGKKCAVDYTLPYAIAKPQIQKPRQRTDLMVQKPAGI